MGSYINSSLTSSERVIKEAKVSWWSQWSYFLFGGLLLPLSGLGFFAEIIGFKGGHIVGGLLIALGAVLLIIALMRIKTTELAVTNKRVIAKTGFIKRDTIELKLHKIEGFMVTQTVMGRIFNYGTVSVSGTGDIKTTIEFISNPTGFRKAVNEVSENPNLG